jgi:hypothetical protein
MLASRHVIRLVEHDDEPSAEMIELVERNGCHGAEPVRVGSGDMIRVFKRDHASIHTAFECRGDRLHFARVI